VGLAFGVRLFEVYSNENVNVAKALMNMIVVKAVYEQKSKLYTPNMVLKGTLKNLF
jgi:hypothetical protein